MPANLAKAHRKFMAWGASLGFRVPVQTSAQVSVEKIAPRPTK